MSIKPLEEDFRRMGLSNNEIRESMRHMVSEKTEADLLSEDQEEDFGDDVYLSDLVDEMEEELDSDPSEEDELEEDALLEKLVRLHKGTAKQRRQAKQYYKRNKSKINRAMKRKRRTGAYKRHQAKLNKMSKGGVRTRRVVSHREDPGAGRPSMHEDLLNELNVLAEAIDREPRSRFDEFVEAFNHIADLGEMAAMQVMDEDEEAAMELLSVSLKADAILKEMEDLGNALSLEEDEELEATLAEAMEEVGLLFEEHGMLAMLSEDDEESEEDGDFEVDFDEDDLEEDETSNPFLDAVAGISEAKRGAQTKGRKVLNPSSTKTKKGKSKWSKSTTSSAAQLRGRADVRNKEALLGYLKKVKAGKVAPGQPLAMSKSGKPLSKGARAAQKAAGKYKGA